VFQIVSSGARLLPVDEGELTAIRKGLESGLMLYPWLHLQVGDRVTIGDGPLRGLEGTIASVKGRDCLIVTVTLLNRSVAIELGRDSLQQPRRSESLLPRQEVIVSRSLTGTAL
jgi:transcription antitermination factor NusG